MIKRTINWFRNHKAIAAVLAFLVTVALLVAFAPSTLEAQNPIIWICTQVLIVYILFSLIFYVTLYGIKFRWADYRGGQLIFALTSSLAGVMLLVVTGFFINPATGFQWYEIPEEAFFWRPILRFVMYVGVAATVSAMNYELISRLNARSALAVRVPLRDDSRL